MKTALVILYSTEDKMKTGEWSQKLCIEEDLYHGSLLPQLDWAKSHNYHIAIINIGKQK